MKNAPLIALVAVAVASAAAPSAVQAQDGVIEYRQSIMQSFRIHMGGVRAAVDGTVPMDHAGRHAVSFYEMALSLANVFPEGSTSADSRALPAIWQDRDGFIGAVTDIQTATANLVEATETGDAEAVSAALGGVQATCRACHTDFRGPAN